MEVMKRSVSTSKKVFLISLAVLLLLSLVNWGLVTGWGDTRVTRINLVGDNGMQYSALMYVPKAATNENPLPGIMMYHGNSGNARNHESWALEFARRDFVCLSVDNNGAGNGEYSGKIGNLASPDLFTNYFVELPFVDAQQLVFSGHSMGADITLQMAADYQPVACVISDCGPFGTEDPYYGNTLYINGKADKLNPIDDYRQRAKDRFTLNGVEVEDEVLVPDKVYGSFEEGNASMLTEIDGQIHEGAFVSHNHIAALLNFAQKSVQAPNPLDGDDQIWFMKDMVGLLGMLSFAFFLVALAVVLIDTVPFFQHLKQPLPRNIGMRGKDLAISITAALLFPVLCLFTGSFGLVNLFGTKAPNVPIFQVRYTNIAMATVIALNLLGLVMVFVFHKVWGKKKFNAGIRDYGLTSEGSSKLDWLLIGKAAALAVTVVAIGWLYLAVQGGLLGTDFYCMFFGYKPISANKFGYYIPYMLVWVVCFVMAAIGMNVERRLPSTGKENLDTLIAVVFNGLLATAGITIMVIVENSIQLSLGTSATALANWGTDITRLWGMPVGMFIGGAGNTYMYRKTGSVWPGAILMGIVCALNSCLYGQIQF